MELNKDEEATPPVSDVCTPWGWFYPERRCLDDVPSKPIAALEKLQNKLEKHH